MHCLEVTTDEIWNTITQSRGRLAWLFALIYEESSRTAEESRNARWIKLDYEKNESISAVSQVEWEHFGITVDSLTSNQSCQEQFVDKYPYKSYQEAEMEFPRLLLQQDQLCLVMAK